jgi:hypothetical protein
MRLNVDGDGDGMGIEWRKWGENGSGMLWIEFEMERRAAEWMESRI